jgi:hypothetical protein
MSYYDYNNLPLASIPETKDSILEEYSNWGGTAGATVKTNKLSMIRSGGGAVSNVNSQLNSEAKE